MTEVVERLVATLEADIRGFTKGMAEAQKQFDARAAQIERRQTSLMGRMNSGFALGGRGLNGLIARYTSWGAILTATQRIVRQSIEVNEEAAASWERLQETITKLADTAGPAVAGFFDGLNQILKRDISDIEKLISLWDRLRAFGNGGLNIPMGVSPLQPGYNTSAKFNPSTKNWTTSPGGFPVPGVTDVTPDKQKGKTVAERERAIYLDTMQVLEDLIKKRHEANADFQRQQGEEAQGIRNRDPLATSPLSGLTQTEMDALEQFHADAKAAWDDYYEHQAEAAESAYEARLRQADTFFGSLATLTRSSSEELQAIGKAAAIIQATIDGVLAVQKALASAPPPINFALAAAVGAAAAVNVAEIAGMEKGGRVSAGTPYIVGEKRPELFVPDRAGTIVPRIPQAMAAGSRPGSSGPIHINIDARYATEGVAEQIKAAVVSTLKTVDRNFASNMVRAQRDRL